MIQTFCYSSLIIKITNICSFLLDKLTYSYKYHKHIKSKYERIIMNQKVKYKYSAISIAVALLIILLIINISLLVILKVTLTSIETVMAINGIYILSIFLIAEGFDSVIVQFLALLAICGLSSFVSFMILNS